MKQTAIEWLIEQMIERKYFARVLPLPYPTLEHLINQAKAMEKEQIKNAYRTGDYDVIDNPDREAEQYYNETFKLE